jgi:CheY-like chemotaxis protein
MNMLILVVDEEPDVEVLFRQQFRRDLRAGRFAMEFAQSAPLALQRITDAKDQSLILILSDINMPGMSGFELLPKAKAMRPDVPIIMITAYGDAETKRKALENGAGALLIKPIDFGTLRALKSTVALSAPRSRTPGANLPIFVAVREVDHGALNGHNGGRLARQFSGGLCCKSRKLQGYEFSRKIRKGKQSPIRITSIALPKSPMINVGR